MNYTAVNVPVKSFFITSKLDSFKKGENTACPNFSKLDYSIATYEKEFQKFQKLP
jgi:hypothetical protein